MKGIAMNRNHDRNGRGASQGKTHRRRSSIDVLKVGGPFACVAAAAALLTLVLTSGARAEDPPAGNKAQAAIADRFGHWTHFTIADSLPGSAWGTAGPVLGNFDGDGRLDMALSRREPQEAYWFQRRQDGVWVRHTIGRSPGLADALGAAALDIDGDGYLDLVFNRVWFKNPGNLKSNPDAPWLPQPFAGGGHDIIAADLNGDGRLDIVTFNGKELSYFDPARGLAQTVIAKDLDQHGGIAPHGVSDLNGDGFPDVVVAGAWFENPGRSKGTWTRHTWPHRVIPNASYGTSIRCWVADLNQDGKQDIVYSDCDTGGSHVYWVENKDRGEHWVPHDLPDPPTCPGDVPGTGSFHSLAVADFDGDGALDIFAGEQEDPDTYMTQQGRVPMKPPGLKPRGVVWANSGGPNPSFVPVVIHVGNPGWHDTAVGDVDGDGAPDLVSKIWNKDGPTYHADFWHNDNRSQKSAPSSPK